MFARRGTPRRDGYGDLFADWEIAVAQNLARQAIRWFPGLRSLYGQEGLVQEGLFHWEQVRGGYRPGRGASLRTYMGKVVRMKLLEIARSENADKRKVNSLAIPMSAPTGTEGRTIEDEVAEIPGHLDEDELADLKRLLEMVAGKLTPRERAAVELLNRSWSKAQIAKELRIHRSTLDLDLERIRKVFQDNGLKDFIK